MPFSGSDGKVMAGEGGWDGGDLFTKIIGGVTALAWLSVGHRHHNYSWRLTRNFSSHR